MADFPLLKQWHFDGARCVLWRDTEGVVHGAAIRGQLPALSVAMPRGADLDQVAAALEAATEATTPRTRMVDTSVITDALLVMSHQEIDQRGLQMPFRLADDLWMLPAHPNLERAIVHACDSRGRDSYISVDLRGPGLYVLARTLPAETSSFGWDSDQRLQLAVALSRLIRPTPINLRFAVRITGDFQSGSYTMRPAEIRGHTAQAAVMNPHDAWLRENDIEELRKLLAAWDAFPFDETTPRWSRALWHLEYAMGTNYFHLRWPLIALGFEALITTDQFDSSRQFRTRFGQVRHALGLPPVSDKETKKIWGHRSDVVHGGRVPNPATEAGRLYELLEETLRGAVRLAVTDPEFRTRFAKPESINTTLPVPKPVPRMAKCPKFSTTFPTA